MMQVVPKIVVREKVVEEEVVEGVEILLDQHEAEQLLEYLVADPFQSVARVRSDSPVVYSLGFHLKNALNCEATATP